MRLVIIGSGGRIGRALVRLFSGLPGCGVQAYDRGALALETRGGVEAVLGGQDWDVLINAAAMTNVDACESDPDGARRVNAEAPAWLAELSRARGGRTVHLSTDYVFDGEAEGLRCEDDPARPWGVYGRTKRDGELAVLDADRNNLVIRTSWVFGPDRPGFPDMILDKARGGERVEAIGDKWSSPCYAEDFAGWLHALLAVKCSGVLHLCNSGQCSWAEYGQAVLDIASRLGISLRTREVVPIRLADMHRFVARRPVHTAMDTSRFTRETGLVPRGWREALEEFLATKVPGRRC